MDAHKCLPMRIRFNGRHMRCLAHLSQKPPCAAEDAGRIWGLPFQGRLTRVPSVQAETRPEAKVARMTGNKWSCKARGQTVFSMLPASAYTMIPMRDVLARGRARSHQLETHLSSVSS